MSYQFLFLPCQGGLGISWFFTFPNVCNMYSRSFILLLASRSTVSPLTLPTAAESSSSLFFHLNVPIFWRLLFLTSQTSPFHICRHLHSLIEQVNIKIYKKSLEERSQLCKGSNSLYKGAILVFKVAGTSSLFCVTIPTLSE